MVTHTYNTNTWKTGGGQKKKIQGQPQTQSRVKAKSELHETLAAKLKAK